MRIITTLLLLTAGFISHLVGQQTISFSLNWADRPERIHFNGETTERWSFEGAAYGSEFPGLPILMRRFAVAGGGQLRVTVVDAAWESFSPANEEVISPALGPELNWTTGLVREGGRWFGKISCIPVVRSAQGEFRRATSLRVRIDHLPEAAARGPVFTDRSALADGTLYKLATTGNGVHKLTYDFLRNQLGISNLDDIDPRTIRLFGNGSGYLPYRITEERPDDLIEMPVRIVGEEDGSFDSGDYLLFYGQGPHAWSYDAERDQFNRQTNIYDEENHYFIRIGSGNGLRVAQRPSLPEGDLTIDRFDEVIHLEEEKQNILHEIPNPSGSGQNWYGDFFRIARDKSYDGIFNFPDRIESEPVRVRAMMALRTRGSSRYYVSVNGEQLTSDLGGTVNIGGELTSSAARRTALQGEVLTSGDNLEVELSYPFPGGSTESEAWLDWLQLRAVRELKLQGAQMNFRSTASLAAPSAAYRLRGMNAGRLVWDITDPLQPVAQQGQLTGETLSWNAPAGSLREFTVFDPEAQLLVPEPIGRVDNQNLHGIDRADMLIVYHPDFEAQAMRLADHRRQHSGLQVVTADIFAVYNEFSGGSVDVTAVRDFGRMLFERDTSFRYLLLLGDGSFDQRDIYGLGTNFLPVFEIEGNISEVGDYPSDDYFGIFFGRETGHLLGHDLSIAVGRLPVKTAAEAEGVVSKIIRYDISPDLLGDWRTRLVYVGDDEDSGIHTRDANRVAVVARQKLPIANVDKLYFDLFPQQSTPAGDRFPEVTEGIDRAIFKGAFAITYLGHGGPRGWGQERVLSIPQVRKWRNEDRLPVFLTATCTFAGYDDASFVSAGEEILLNPRGGAIGLLTTTRPVYASQNLELTMATTEFLTERPDGRWQTLGDIIRRAKNSRTNGSDPSNDRRFTLLGDPAQVIALPEYGIETTHLNGVAVTGSSSDTLRALQKVTISGRVVDRQGNPLSDFNGTVYPTVYDKAIGVRTLQQDPGSPAAEYEIQKNVLFKGRATVSDGQFSFTFIIPKDINYAFGQGRISYYAADPGRLIDAAGYYEQVVIGGTDPDALADEQGPQVEVFMNSEDFVFGGEVQPDATLLVRLSDDNGINVTGNSIGHDLEAILDDNTSNTLLLNDFYEADEDDYRSGRVRFPLSDLEPGRHTVRVRAWDVANNSAEGLTEFVVAADGRVALERVLNYPNPFTDRTCFQFDHNLAGEDIEVLVQIFTVSGTLVKTLTGYLPASDGALRLDDCIAWDGRDDYGAPLARGVYLYQVRIRSASGTDRSASSDFEKLVILK